LSISDSKLVEVFEQERPQVVSHQAAQTVLTRSMAEPIFDGEQNILGSLNVILNCLKFGVNKIVYASSGGAIYGEPQYLPVDENHPINPISLYGISKHTVEHYLYLYGMLHGLNYVALRYPNVYGPRQNPEAEAGVVAIFAREMIRGEQPTIFGSGDKTRDYTFISDVVVANILAMGSEKSEIYNIGTGKETSDQEIFDTVAEVLGYKGTAHYAPVREGEIQRICLDYTKAMRELGWLPQVRLQEGVRRAVEYYRSRLV
jgi:UDP-glucose 4-epimerase